MPDREERRGIIRDQVEYWAQRLGVRPTEPLRLESPPHPHPPDSILFNQLFQGVRPGLPARVHHPYAGKFIRMLRQGVGQDPVVVLVVHGQDDDGVIHSCLVHVLQQQLGGPGIGHFRARVARPIVGPDVEMAIDNR